MIAVPPPRPVPPTDDPSAPKHRSAEPPVRVPDASDRVVERLATLDAVGALRADLDALRGAERAGADAGRLEAEAGVWLPIVGMLEQLRRLASRRRAAYLRAGVPVWGEAATCLREPRYARVGARLARWRAVDPGLALVRELLWVLEQVESIGGVHLACVGLAAVGGLVPAESRPYGYVLAQSGRPLRTLGAVEAALDRYARAARVGRRHRDRWLRARSDLGTGSTHTHRGNHPAARVAFRSTLRQAPAGSALAHAAHHGLAVCAIAAGDYDAAFAHGWQALQARHAGPWGRADVLGLLSGLCRRVGRPRAALRAAQAALASSGAVRHRVALYRIALQAAIALDEEPTVRAYAGELRRCVHAGGGPFDDARGWLALAEAHAHLRESGPAADAVTRATTLAERYGYHELEFAAEAVGRRVREGCGGYQVGAGQGAGRGAAGRTAASGSPPNAGAAPVDAGVPVGAGAFGSAESLGRPLNRASARVVERLATLPVAPPVAGDSLLAV